MHSRLPAAAQTGCGALIAFCGIDGCGKTTHTQTRGEIGWSNGSTGYWSPGNQAISTAVIQRSRDFLQRYIPDRLNAKNWWLLSALDRQFHLRTIVEPAISAGSNRGIVRPLLTNSGAEAIAFSRAVLIGTVVRQHNPGIPKPALTVYLDVPGRVCHERILKRDGKWSSIEEQDFRFPRKGVPWPV